MGTKPIKAKASRPKRVAIRRRHVLTIAKHDAAHCCAPGLFRSLPRGIDRLQSFQVIYRHGPLEITFTSPWLLGADDMKTLTGLVALAGTSSGETIEPHEMNEKERTALMLSGAASASNLVRVTGSFYSLAHEIGYTSLSGTKIDQVRESLRRLAQCSVQIIDRSGARELEANFQLIAFPRAVIDTESKGARKSHFEVVLNPRLTSSVIGTSGYAWIVMDEVRGITSDPAILMHSRLCGWIKPRGTGSIELNNLCAYAWPDPATSADVMKQRRTTARKLLDQFRTIGWAVTVRPNDVIEFQRPEPKLHQA